MKFVGIDLGWVNGASGLCCLQLQGDRLQILDIRIELEHREIFNWLEKQISPQKHAMVAVDAPTIIPNQTGMRLPDRLTHKYFGKYHAGCYPANLNRPFAHRTVDFGNKLKAKGFVHASTITPQQLGRYQIEVFPHPAIVHLFDLDKIIKYKKGKLADKKEGLKQLRNYIINVFPHSEPKLILQDFRLPIIPDRVSLKKLKVIEDCLDSLVCAYIAAYWWWWGEARNIVLGDEITGYIIVPKRL